jgi:hypothetical protein
MEVTEMNEYAISLYFNEQIHESLLELINIAADSCANRYMLEPSLIPPHITVCYFSTDNPDAVIKLIDEKVKTLVKGKLIWPALGVFPTSVLYAAPVLNKYLLNVCLEFNSLLDSKVKLADYYRPYNWMPHTALATKLTVEQLNQAFIAVSEKFAPMMGTATALSLAVCERFNELITWELNDELEATN